MEELIVCEICNEEICEEAYIGCCNDGNCKKDVELMCKFCATWIEEEEVWLCPDCLLSQ